MAGKFDPLEVATRMRTNRLCEKFHKVTDIIYSETIRWQVGPQ